MSLFAMFSVYDSKAQAFLPPWIMPQTTMAQRTFSDCANSKDHQFGVHPEDYTLFQLGMWDDETGVLDQLPSPRSLGLALEYVKRDTLHGQMDLIEATEGPPNGKDKRSASLTDDASIRPRSSSSDSEGEL